MKIELTDMQLQNLYYVANKVKLEKEKGVFAMIEMSELDELITLLDDAIEESNKQFRQELWNTMDKRAK
jgi:hypothetical protein